MRAHRVLGCLLFGGSVWAQQYVISTIAGGAPPATPAIAPAASIGDPTRLATDAAGNVYFGSLHSVFKVDAGGTLTRVAGNGRAGNSGDGGPAATAQLNFPMGIAMDAAGNVFVADRDASVVRKIAANGTITTVAGSGTPGFAGDGGAATSAQINGPFGVAVDAAGNLYIADTGNEVVRKVSPDGTMSTVAGTGTRGYLGDGGAARNAWLNGPEGVARGRGGEPVHRRHLQRAHTPCGHGRHHHHRGRRGLNRHLQRRRRPGEERRPLAANGCSGGPRGEPVHRRLRQQQDPRGDQRDHHHRGGQDQRRSADRRRSGGQRAAGRAHGRDGGSQRDHLLRGGRDRVGHGPGAGRLQGLEGLDGGRAHHAGGERHTELFGRRNVGDGGATQRSVRSGGGPVRGCVHFGHAEPAGARGRTGRRHHHAGG